MKRVLVIGCPGAGKSTFVRRLRDVTGQPLYYLDMMWHKPDRTTVTREQFDARLQSILKRDAWIIDGNYARTLPQRLEYCDTVFFLDFPTDICVAGAEQRIGVKREDMPWVEHEFEEEFRRQGIPYRIYGGMSFYQRKEIKDVIAYFRLIVNPHDEEAFRRIVNYPARGIGNTTLQKIAETAQKHAVSMWTVADNPSDYALAVSGGTLAKISVFCQLISTFRQRNENQATNAYQLAEAIVKESGVAADIYGGTDPESLGRQENLEELLSSIQEFVDIRTEEGRASQAALSDYLQEVALLTDADKTDADPDRVSLMTIHAAKGLEFPTVFVVGLEENILPSAMSAASLRELEEERRLLYVAITRAERHCILTCAKNRWRYGKMEFGSPSRFIRDIDPRLIQADADAPSGSPLAGTSPTSRGVRFQNSRPVATQFRADPMPKLTSPRRPETPVDPFSPSFKERIALSSGRFKRIPPASHTAPASQTASASSSRATGVGALTPGTVIEHQRFGIGTVVKVEGAGENTKATVDFRNTGTKQLLLKFAKYNIVKS